MTTGPGGRFHAHLLPWVREHGGVPDAVIVNEVEPRGTDWYGDTENGYDTNFEVTIQGQRENGESFWRDVAGEDLTSLWKWTVQEGFGDAPPPTA